MCITMRITSKISRRKFNISAIGLSAAAGIPLESGRADVRNTPAEFRDIPNAYRMRMHWYVFGPAWEATECDRQLARMAAQHIGGVLIFPTYPIAVDDPARGIRNLEYLSPEFLKVLGSVAKSARNVGLTIDIVLGTGWPYGGPSVSLEDSAKSIRMRRAAGGVAPALEAGEHLVSSGESAMYTSMPTRMQVKRASLGAEGLVLDHYNHEALGRYLESVGDKLIPAAAPGGIRSIFCDSFEVYRATWTAAMPAKFREWRGYDIVPHLDALFDSAHPDSRDVRCDFWRTLSELAEMEFVKPLGEWAHRRGVTTQVEAYGTPPVSLAAYRWVDVPVGEHYEWKEFSTSRWASSGAHLAGKPVVLAEAWTWTGLPNRFADTLEDLKLCSDLHFLCGINALYGLTYAYSPESLGSPGWVPYFGPAVNHTSPYWPYFSHLADYANRASYVLQQGKPVVDIGVYLPAEDAMADHPPDQLLLNWAVRDRLSSNGAPPEFRLKNALHYESDVVKTLITNGYSFDGVDAFTLPPMQVQAARLRMGDCDFAVVVLPNLTGIDLPAVQKIAEFVREGGSVIATRRLPDTAWGMNGRDENRATVRQIVAEVFGSVPPGTSFVERSYGKGRAIFAGDEVGSFRKALERVCRPDIRFTQPSEHVGFVHRRAPGREFYFIANTSTEPQPLDAKFRTPGGCPERWHLDSGEVETVAVFEPSASGTRLRFTLGPLESRVYAFTPDTRKPAAVESELEVAGTESGWSAKAWWNGRYRLRLTGGDRTIDVKDVPAPLLLSPAWTLAFEGSAIEPVRISELRSWTDIDRPASSGTGVYEAEIENPFAPSSDLGIVLDLGRVRETADVSVNARAAGVAWMRPHRVDVSAVIKAGRNRIRIAVTNLLINKILGNGPIDYSAVFAKYGNRFPAGEEWDVVREPFPSGLLGRCD